MYDKPLWDDRAGLWGMNYEAPTLRQVVDVGVSIAALATGNVWLAAAVNLADEAVFGLADVAGGYKSWTEVGVEFGKKALVGVGTAAIGGAFNGFTPEATGGLAGTLPGSGFGSVVGRTLLTGLQSFTTNAFSGAII
jgi:hypothetical protein